jgi:predicted O-methyltransferase YrrM
MPEGPVRAPLAPHRLAAIAIEEREAVQKPSELTELLALVADLRPRRVVEIGTYRGGSLWAFAQLAASDAILLSIDLPGGEFGAGYDGEVESRFANFLRHEQRIVTLPLDSHDPATVAAARAALEGVPVDLLFIDGDHSYEGVKRDFELYAPLVRPGGIVALHDILADSDWEGSDVDRLWAEVRDSHRSREIVAEDEGLHMGRWAGIGVLWIE